jgi:hypothetical protein
MHGLMQGLVCSHELAVRGVVGPGLRFELQVPFCRLAWIRRRPSSCFARKKRFEIP